MKFEKLENNRGKFTFEVTPEEFEHALDHAFAHVAQDLELKGFRKGKVPRNVYENKFGVESLYEEAVNHALNHKYYEVRQNPEYGFIGEPQVDVDFASISREKAFNVSLIFELKPEVTLGAYKGVEVEKEAVEVTDKDVDFSIDQLLAEKSELVVVEKAIENGMTAIFDFEGFVDGEAFEGGKAENYSLEIGSNQFIPGFEAQMVGLKAGDQKDLNVKFPEQYQAENLAGKDAVFKVLIHEVKEKTLPELNDEFVASLDREDAKTVEELKTATKQKLESEKLEQAKAKENEAIISKVVEASVVEVPKTMIDTEFVQYREQLKEQAKQYGLDFEMYLQFSGLTPESFEEQARKDAEARLKVTLVIEAIAKAEDFSVTDEELVARKEKLAGMYNLKVEDIDKYLTKNMIELDIKNEKAYNLVLDSAKRV